MASPSTAHMTELSCRILDKNFFTEDIFELRIKAATGGNTHRFDYKPGQYAILATGNHEARPYSIAGMPGHDYLAFHIKDMGHGLSHELANLKPGAEINVSYAGGDAYLQPKDHRPIIAIGGGLGLAPLIPIIDTALPLAPERDIYLFHGGVTQRDLYMDQTLTKRADHIPHLHYYGISETANTIGESGVVGPVALRHLPQDLSGFTAYLSGGPAMVLTTAALLNDRGLDFDDMHSDALTEEVKKAGIPK